MIDQLTEDLAAGDLRMLVSDIIEIDSYASKMGSDEDIVVLTFTVDSLEPAKDLVNFIEKGYDFVLDADSTPGELTSGKYKVFVEIERNRKIADQIMQVLHGVTQLADVPDWRYRYYKSFRSEPVTLDSLGEVPINKADYIARIQNSRLNNFSNFFNRSYLESIELDDNDINFQKIYSEPLRMRIKQFGLTNEVYKATEGRIVLEGNGVAESMYLTKYIGNYNITKVGTSFIFENNGYAVALERV